MKKNYSYLPFFIIAAIYIGYMQVINRDNLLYALLVLSFLFILIMKKDLINVNKNVYTIGMLLWMIYSLFSIFKTFLLDSGVKYVIVIMVFTIISIILSGLDDWSTIFLRTLVILLLGHVFYTTFSICCPKSALSFSAHFLSGEAQELTTRWVYEMHHYAGISGQTAINALFFSILLGCIFAVIFTTKRIQIKFIMLCCGVGIFALLFLTGKKASIAVSVFGIFVMYLFYYMQTKNFGKIKKYIALLVLAVCILILVCVCYISPEKFHSFLGTSVISREKILKELWLFFIQSPLLGNGVDSVAYYAGHSAHNNYVQLLCEYGLIGFTLFMTIQCFILYDIVKKTRRCIHKKCILRSEKVVVLFSVFYCVYFWITGLFESTLFNYRMYLIYVLSIAACYSIQRKARGVNEGYE